MKSITVVLALSAIALIGFFIYSNLNTIDTDSQGEQQAVLTFEQDINPLTVEYTNDGYIPNTLEVKKGDSVTFINKSSRSMWVSSDNHPTHTIYPEFDQRGFSTLGETFTFTFEKPGTWEYHDHLNPRANGSVVVN
jgi:plastocyanin